MKKIIAYQVIALTSFFLVFFVDTLYAGRPTGSKPTNRRLGKVTTNDTYLPMDINQVLNYYSNNGDGSFNKYTADNEGFEFPKGSGGDIVFEDGIVWGLFQNGTLKVGGSTYNHGLQAGKILTPGSNTSSPVADDPDLAKYRIYRVRADVSPWTPFSSDMDALLTNEEVQYLNRFASTSSSALYQQYVQDWNQWPAADGAPWYVDSVKVARYDAAYDHTNPHHIPGVPGADQTMWYVSNDLSSTLTLGLYGSDPIGIEEQKTIWAYKSGAGTALGYTIFSMTKLINKSGTELDSMFISQWVDPDLGGSKGATDDYVGCDTSNGRDLGYVYNGEAIDPFFGKLVPSGGFMLLQGPVDSTGDPNDVAMFDFSFRHGYKPKRLSAFNFFVNGNPTYEDPELALPAGTTEWYRLMNGLVSTTGASYTDPITDSTTKILLYGDPVKGTGWIDGSLALAGDRRMCLITGPITMKPGDTTQIYIATLAAVCGDRVSSVDNLRFYADKMKGFFNGGLHPHPLPVPPSVSITALNNEIILNWQNDAVTAVTESFNKDGYLFEGYNVYQLPTSAPNLTAAKRIGTFDLHDLITIISDEVFDANQCATLVEPVQKGNDAGVQHYIDITSDVFDTYGTGLVNGEHYYFAVTAYAYNPTAGHDVVLETPFTVIDTVPRAPDLGVRVGNGLDTIMAAHVSGISTAIPLFNVVDPTKLTGDDYQVDIVATDSIFDPTSGQTFPNPKWELKDITHPQVILPFSTVYRNTVPPGDRIYNGFQFELSGAPHWVAGSELGAFEYTPSAHMNWAGVNTGLSFFGGGLDVAGNFIASRLNPWEVYQDVEIVFDSHNGQNAYDFKRTVTGGSGGAPYAGFYPQPFRVYNITDPSNPKQIDFIFMERDGQPTENNIWAPGVAADNREYFFFVDTAYTSTAKDLFTEGAAMGDVLSVLPAVWEGWSTLKEGSKPAYRDGDVWKLITAKPLTVNDRWLINTAHKAPRFSSQLRGQDMSLVNVFPNPYFGFNKAETDKYHRFVTFSHLPAVAKIRIFTLSGILVKTIVKNNPNTPFQRWDLQNESGIPVAAGIYIAYIDMPGVGTKTLKLAIIPETQFLDVY